ncbi:MAG: hypothetical protein Q7V10_08870 [Methanobacteriaceae archaeon]|jgi:hypothetical protein|nr:hypothetical protein [Methanobacteriaceae archaeon]MDO9627158.1 hypothetical protein [Methanobacteriaceae archaeon]
MEKYDSVIIVIAIIIGALIVGGAVLLGSFLISQGVTIFTDDNETVLPTAANDSYLKPINGSELKDYDASCVQLENSVIPTGWDTSSLVAKNVKCTGKIVSILSNSSNSSDIIIQVPEITKYPFIVVTYGDSAPFNSGNTINIFGEYGDLASIPDPNSGEYKMVPMIQAVYLQKS